jgi:uncharacterized surface protein with fasciclin (FAS1) repeats
MKFFAALLMILAITFCYAEDSSPTTGIDDPNISVFVQALHKAGLNDIFVGTGPFTGFVPTNDAMERMNQNEWEELQRPENRDRLTNFLLHHIVHGKYMSRNLKKSKSIKPLNGNPLEISYENGVITVNKAKLVRTDMTGPNGVIHEIDAVLKD